MARIDLKTAAVSSHKSPGTIIDLPLDASREARNAAVAQAIETGQPIAIGFVKFNDGRGFSLARLIRSELGYIGEILATGHTIPDQALHLLRSGFDSVEVSDTARLTQWQRSLASYSGSYQRAARNPLSLRREASRHSSFAASRTPGSPARNEYPPLAVEFANDFA